MTEIAHREDRALSAPAAHIWHVGDGKATEFWGAPYDTHVLDEFWA